MTTDPPGLDLLRLRVYLDEQRPGLVLGALEAELIHGGRSNLTYRVTDGSNRWVARRPPLGHVLPTAHNMAREFRVISALGLTRVPVPRAELLCPDPDVLGAPFYLMADVAGTVYRSAEQSERLGPERATALAHRLIDVLADLHDLDPASVGLGEFGRPDGYLERQLTRWRSQLDASRCRTLPGIDELHERLTARVPQRLLPPAILHGDFRLDNAIVDADDQVAAVIDWEMATVGDPLADVALFQVYWDLAAGVSAEWISTAVRPGLGFPTGAELCRRYASRRGVELTAMPWYRAFNYFKVAVILEGIHFRFVAGHTVGAGFDGIGAVVPHLVASGHAALDDGTEDP